MKKLHLDTLTVDTFATSEGFAVDESTIALEPEISDGFECNRTLYLTCDTCRCQTPRYNCV